MSKSKFGRLVLVGDEVCLDNGIERFPICEVSAETAEEAKAFGVLFAASPAMYEALFKMVVAFAPWDCPTVKQDEALRAAKAALASADGEARS